MDWNDLRYFLAVIDGGSLSAAAKRLNVSQPTMGRRMAALESRLGTRLFERRGRGYVLTAEGENLAGSVRRMEDEALAAERRLGGRDSSLAGTVRLSATEGIGALWLPPRLSRFTAGYPDIRLELILDNTAVNLSRREADVAIRMQNEPGRLSWQDALIGRNLGRLRIGLYASPDYLAAHGTPRAVADLKRHAAVGLAGFLVGASYNQWLLDAGARQALSTNSLLAQLNAVRAGFGIAAMASALIDDDMGLVPLMPDLALPAPDVWLLYHADMKHAARIRAVVDFLADEIAADPKMTADQVTRP